MSNDTNTTEIDSNQPVFRRPTIDKKTCKVIYYNCFNYLCFMNNPNSEITTTMIELDDERHPFIIKYNCSSCKVDWYEYAFCE